MTAPGVAAPVIRWARTRCCAGYGVWAQRPHAPMLELDARAGLLTRPCPTCGANANPCEAAGDKERR